MKKMLKLLVCVAILGSGYLMGMGDSLGLNQHFPLSTALAGSHVPQMQELLKFYRCYRFPDNPKGGAMILHVKSGYDVRRAALGDGRIILSWYDE